MKSKVKNELLETSKELNLVEVLEEFKKLIEVDKSEKEILLTKDMEEKGLAYEQKLREVLAFTNRLVDKQKGAKEEIKSIKNKIVALNVERLKEEDPSKIEEIETKKKDLYLQLQSLEELEHTNIFAIVKNTYLKELQSYEQQSQNENLEFMRKIADKMSFFTKLEDLIKIKKSQLAVVKYAHPHEVSCDSLLKEIKKVATSNIKDNDGWVSDGNSKYMSRKNTTISVDCRTPGQVTETNNINIVVDR